MLIAKNKNVIYVTLFKSSTDLKYTERFLHLLSREMEKYFNPIWNHEVLNYHEWIIEFGLFNLEFFFYFGYSTHKVIVAWQRYRFSFFHLLLLPRAIFLLHISEFREFEAIQRKDTSFFFCFFFRVSSTKFHFDWNWWCQFRKI